MNIESIQPARAALYEATSALDVLLQIGPEPSDLKASGTAIRAWCRLLAFGNRVYTKLEQASKSSDDGRKWWDTKEDERGTDPLLVYMHKARNADEHTLTKIVHNDGGSFNVSVPAHLTGVGRPILVLDPTGGGNHRPAHPDIKLERTSPPRIILQPMRDRKGTYPVPHEHSGSPIENVNLQTIGTLFIRHLEALISEAERKLT